MLSRIVLPCAFLLGLAACTSQSMPDDSTRLSLSPANLLAQPSGAYGQGVAAPSVAAGGGLPFDSNLVHRVAARYAADWRAGGMPRLVADLRGCYATADRDPSQLKDCLALDVAGKNRDMADQQRFRISGVGYFTNEAELMRFNRYAPRVFGSQAEALGFVGNDGRASYFQGTVLLGEG